MGAHNHKSLTGTISDDSSSAPFQQQTGYKLNIALFYSSHEKNGWKTWWYCSKG